MTLPSQTTKQHYSKELAAYTLLQFYAARASLAQDKAAANKLPVTYAINSGMQRAAAAGMLHSRFLTHVFDIFRRSDVDLS
jgi:hypothetical protein